MNPKLVAAISILGAMPALAQGAPVKPTVADVQRVVQIITSDKAKSAAYCELEKVEQQIAEAEEKKDTKKIEELGKKAEALAQKIGPEYIKLMEGLEQVDDESAEGQRLNAASEPLDKLCSPK